MQTLSLIISLCVAFAVVIVSLLFRSYLPTYFAQKAKNLAQREDIDHLTRTVELIKHEFTAEVERLKAGLDRATHASKQQFDAEFTIYREIWEKLVVLRGTFFALRPYVSDLLPKEEDQARMQRRIAAFNSAYSEFVNSVDRNEPFYSQDVYDASTAIVNVCIDATIDYQYDEPVNYWKSAKQNREKLLKAIDVACKAIRTRFQTLTTT